MLDLSDRPELRPLALVVRALRVEGGVRECLLVGAMARDIQLELQHGIQVIRATKDMDFAVAVLDWATFMQMREALLASNLFQVRGKALHALTFVASTPVDLIPFGGVLRPDLTIAWPPDQDPVMSLLAYPEAWKRRPNVEGQIAKIPIQRHIILRHQFLKEALRLDVYR